MSNRFRDILAAIRRHHDVSEDLEKEFADYLLTLEIDPNSPAMTNFLAMTIVTLPLLVRMRKLEQRISYQMSEIEFSKQITQELVLALNGHASIVVEAPEKIEIAASEGVSNAIREVSAESHTHLMRVLNANFVTKEDMLSVINKDLGKIGSTIKTAILREVEEVKGLRTSVVQKAMSVKTFSIFGSVVLFTGFCFGKFIF